MPSSPERTRAGSKRPSSTHLALLPTATITMPSSRLVRGLIAASPMIAYLGWLYIARPAGDMLVWTLLGVAAVATFALHRFLPRPKD